MMRFVYKSRVKILQLFFLIILLLGVFGLESAFSDSSGLTVKIGTIENQSNLQIPLGVPIGLVMVITNETEWSLYTKKGFSQTEFYKSLHLADPKGEKYIYIPEKETVDTMSPPIIYGDREVLLAEELSEGVVKTIVIDDLRELFPMLYTDPGWYTLETILPFIRFAEVIKIENFGALGLADDENIWQGAVNSNKLQFYLYPAAGGQVNVQVLDGSVDPSAPLFQVPVRLFKTEEVAASNSLKDVWSKAKVMLEGTTDNNGQTKWNSETTPCVIGDNYTVIARYSNEYKDSSTASGNSGWQDGCSGLIEQTITFGEVTQVAIDDLAARAKSGKVQLTWTATEAVYCNVYRSTTKGGPYSFIASTTSTYSTYLDTTVTNGVTFYYVVRPLAQNGDELSQSNEASATPQARARRR